MKNSLIVFRSNPVNIGDWIQCLAASKFFPQIDTHITSRIHCGLPSLECETPVLFVTSEELQSQSKTKVGGRLEGLYDLFHLVTYKKKNTLTLTSELQCKDKLTSKFHFTNKDIFKKYRDSLIQRCYDFVKV